MALGARDADGVGEVELALHVVVADCSPGVRQSAQPSRHITPELTKSIAFSAGLASLLSTIFSSSPSAHDQPAVGRRIACPEAQHADRGLGVAAGLHQPLQALRRQQRRIGIDHQHRPGVPLERGQRGLGRIAGAERLVLDRGRMRGEGRRDPVGARARPRRRPAPASAARRCPGHGAPSACRPPGCRTFGSDDFMRVPAPAASTTTAMGDFIGGPDATGPAVPQDVLRNIACTRTPTISSPAASTP